MGIHAEPNSGLPQWAKLVLDMDGGRRFLRHPHAPPQSPRRTAVVVARRAAASALTADGGSNRRGASKREIAEVELIVPPGSYVNVLETQIHGDRVRGRICWEEEGDGERDYGAKGGGITRRTSRLLKRTAITVSGRGGKRITKRSYEGWLSLQWAKDDRGDSEGGGYDDDMDERTDGAARSGATDEDSGPWVSLSLFLRP